jgi:hypothetical protein
MYAKEKPHDMQYLPLYGAQVHIVSTPSLCRFQLDLHLDKDARNSHLRASPRENPLSPGKSYLQQSYVFQAEHEDDLNEWISAIEHAARFDLFRLTQDLREAASAGLSSRFDI